MGGLGCPASSVPPKRAKPRMGKDGALLCSAQEPCANGEACIPTPGGGGACAKRCTQESECPEGWGCQGRLENSGYCRRQVIQRGKPCGVGILGCANSTRCFRKRCTVVCEKDDDCPGIVSRCVQVVSPRVLKKIRWPVFRACLMATQSHTERCGRRGPYCQRGYVCWRKACTKPCRLDTQCSYKYVCDGEYVRGSRAAAPEFQSATGPPLYCRKAGIAGAKCGDKLELSCKRGAACVKGRCRDVRRVALGQACSPNEGIVCPTRSFCYQRRCHRVCGLDTDCSQIKGVQLRCHTTLDGLNRIKLCR